ncbi:MAG: site-specific DNA-methyltransferase [Gammaproteobacteria bacterium]|nr:site-specific DNA-methyltransferase [Gammaproteobacteria bacterium]
MKCFYKNRGVRLFAGDAVETLNALPEGSVDLIFADPPYNLSNGGFSVHAGKRVSVNKGKWDKSNGLEKDYEFHYNWIAACRRVLKENGALWVSGTYHSIYACGFALQKQGWHLLNEICWYKPNASPHLACRMFAASHETLLWERKTKQAKHKFNYELMKQTEWAGDFIKKPNRQMRSVWAINTPRPGEKKYGKHPTQKPESLLERIVLACSNENDIVLDPFCGSATTGVAALRNNRNFVGIDAEKEYLSKMAVKRIDDVIKQNCLLNTGLGVREESAAYLDKLFTGI